MRESNYLSQKFNSKENKFNGFLNKTIVLQSKKYFKKEIERTSMEQSMISDEIFESYLCKFLSLENEEEKSILKLLLDDGIKELSAIEQSVLFLLYKEDLTQEDASKILEICSTTVSKIKVRAIKKLKKYIEGEF